jgi:surface protein
MKKLFTSSILFLVSFFSFSQQPFITTWQTSNTGTITIPGTGTNYTVSWVQVGNSSNSGDTTVTNTSTIVLPNIGIYQLSFSGGSPAFNGINFLNHINFNGSDTLLSIDQWGSIQWSSMIYAFSGCIHLILNATDIPDLSGVFSLSDMFHGCSSFTGNSSMGNWNTANVTDMSEMFIGDTSFNQPIGSWNTASVINMGGMFEGDTVFNQPIGNWNTENVVDMSGMFEGTTAFNQPIGNWNTAKVSDMSNMFEGATAFNQPIGSWNTANVIYMDGMFFGDSAFNQPIGNWNTTNVVGMADMFNSDIAFNQPIGNWNTANVIDMSEMFCVATTFNQPIGNWNTANVAYMLGMFDSDTAFNQPIGNWNTANVVDMSFMFTDAYSFNQSLGKWNIGNVNNMSFMLDGPKNFSTINYDSTLIGWDAQPVQNGVPLTASGLQYCAAQAARNDLITNKGWTITGDTLDCVMPVTSYTFTGNGNWSDPSNWSNNAVPTSPVPSGTTVTISPPAGNSCTLNVPVTFAAGSTLTVLPGAKFNISANLTMLH